MEEKKTNVHETRFQVALKSNHSRLKGTVRKQLSPTQEDRPEGNERRHYYSEKLVATLQLNVSGVCIEPKYYYAQRSTCQPYRKRLAQLSLKVVNNAEMCVPTGSTL